MVANLSERFKAKNVKKRNKEGKMKQRIKNRSKKVEMELLPRMKCAMCGARAKYYIYKVIVRSKYDYKTGKCTDMRIVCMADYPLFTDIYYLCADCCREKIEQYKEASSC